MKLKSRVVLDDQPMMIIHEYKTIICIMIIVWSLIQQGPLLDLSSDSPPAPNLAGVRFCGSQVFPFLHTSNIVSLNICKTKFFSAQNLHT